MKIHQALQHATTDALEIRPSHEFTGDEPPIRMRVPLFELDKVSPQVLAAHTLITGQPGSGKTQSVLLPMLSSMLAYQLSGCAPTGGLVIDPKCELLARLRQEPGLRERLHVLGEGGLRLDAFEFDPKDSIKARVEWLNSQGVEPIGSGDGAHWRAMGWDLVHKLLQAQAALQSRGMDLAGWMYALLGLRQGLNEAFVVAVIEGREDDEELAQRYTERKGALQEFSPGDRGGDRLSKVRTLMANARLRLATVATAACFVKMRRFLEELSASQDAISLTSRVLAMLVRKHDLACFNPLEKFTTDNELYRQITYFMQSVGPQLSDLCAPGLQDLLELDPTAASGALAATASMRQILDSGGIIVYQPGRLAVRADVLAGKLLRAMFQKYITRRADMEQPLVYACDEFHRYVSCDAHFGDDVFLSFCRSYRVMACLAAQSVVALQTAIAHDKGTALAESATRAMLNNCSNRVWLRTLDPLTQCDVRSIYPFPESHCRPHILDVRPLAKLATGEYYYVASDGRQGRARVRLPVAPSPSVLHAPACS